MATSPDQMTVRELITALAEAEDKLRQMRQEPLTPLSRSHRRHVLRDEAHIIRQLRQRRRQVLLQSTAF